MLDFPIPALGTLLAPLVEAIAPDSCAVCEGPVHRQGQGWCGRCAGDLPWLDPRRCAACGALWTTPGPCRACLGAGRPWTGMVAALSYEDPVRERIQRWKYPGDAALSRPLGHLLLRALGDCRDLGEGCVVPVPQAETSWRGRGFSPSVDLARAVARGRGVALVHAIDRNRGGTPQVGLTADQRQRNVARLFRLAPRRARALAGRQVLLVDDVVTTTSTAAACTEILLKADVESVLVVSLARAWGGGAACTKPI